MPTYRVIVDKSIQFRAQEERFSNGYNFQSATLTEADYVTLIDQVIAVERTIHAAVVKFHGGRLIANWVPGQEGQDSDAFRDLNPPTLGLKTNAALQHPEVTAMAEWPTAQRGVKPKYYHLGRFPNAIGETSALGDMTTDTATILQLTNGSLIGSATLCSPNGALALGPGTFDEWARTRQFRRGGRRPTDIPLVPGV